MSEKNLTDYKIEEIVELNKKLIRLEGNYENLCAQIKGITETTNNYFERLLNEMKELKHSLKTLDEMKIQEAVRESRTNEHEKKIALNERDLNDLKEKFKEHSLTEAATIKAVSKTIKISAWIIGALLTFIFTYIVTTVNDLEKFKNNHSKKTEENQNLKIGGGK